MNSADHKNILFEETVFYEGLQLHYLFWQDLSTGLFHVSVQHGKESAYAALGEDVTFATRCYQAIRNGAVPPCTLEEIALDMIQSEKKQKNLYKI